MTSIRVGTDFATNIVKLEVDPNAAEAPKYFCSTILTNGTSGENRTRKFLRTVDFESTASTNSATEALAFTAR